MTGSVTPSQGSTEVAHENDKMVDDLPAPNDEYADQDEELEPEIHWKAFMVIFSCAVSYASLIWVLVTMGLQSASIVKELGGASVAIWIQNGSTLIAVVTSPALSRISDAVGRKWITVACGMAGAIGCWIIAGAHNMNMAIGGGVLAGFLVGMQGPYSAIVSEVTPRRYRPMSQSLLNMGPAVGGLLGAVGSQAIGVNMGWRAAFYFAGGGCAFAVLMLSVFYNPPATPNPENRSLLTRWLDFDMVGTGLLTAAITPLTIGLTWGGGAYAWSSVHAIAPTAIGAVLLFVFIGHQAFIKKDGLFHHAQFALKNFALCITGNFVEGIFYFVFNAYIGAQAAILYESAPLKFGFFFACFFFPQFLWYPILGWYVKRTMDAKIPLIIGYVVFVGCMIGLAQTGVGKGSEHAVYAISVLAGSAFVPAESLLQTCAQLAVPAELIGTAAALGAAVRSFGGLIGVAIATSIFNSKAAINIPKYVVPAALGAGLPESSLEAFITNLAAGDIPALEMVPGVTGAIIEAGAVAIKEGFAQCFKYIWYFEIPFMVLALVCVSCLASIRSQMNWIINRPVEEITYKKAAVNVDAVGFQKEDEKLA